MNRTLNKNMVETIAPAESLPEACLSVVMPAYNEAATLAIIVGKVLAVPHLLEIIIVDDCSTDDTPRIGQGLAAQDERVLNERLAGQSVRDLRASISVRFQLGSSRTVARRTGVRTPSGCQAMTTTVPGATSVISSCAASNTVISGTRSLAKAITSSD